MLISTDLSSKSAELEDSAKNFKELQKTNEQERAKFERKEQEMMVKISEMKEKLAEAEEKFSCNNLVPTPQSPNVSLVDPTVVSDLREEVELFRDQVNQLKEENSRLKAENDEMNHLSHSHRLEITELKNSMEEKEDELASYRESLRQVCTCSGIFSTDAMGALAPVILGQSITVTAL